MSENQKATDRRLLVKRGSPAQMSVGAVEVTGHIDRNGVSRVHISINGVKVEVREYGISLLVVQKDGEMKVGHGLVKPCVMVSPEDA